MNVVPLARPTSDVRTATHGRRALSRLAACFQPYRIEIGVGCACVVLQTLHGLAGPYLMSVAIDRYIAARDLRGLSNIAAWMLGTFLAANLSGCVAGWVMAAASQKALRGIRRDLFRHLQTLPLSFFDHNPPGELSSRLTNDVDAINQAAAQNVTALFASVLSMAAILVAMFALEWRLGLASLLVVPFMLWFTRLVAVRTRGGFRALQRNLGELGGVMEEAIDGQRVVVAFQRTGSVVDAFREANDAAYRTGVEANTWALVLMPLTTVLGNLLVIVVSIFGGWLALEGKTTVGVVAAFITYSIAFVQPLRQVSNLYNTLQAALAGAERVFQVLDAPSEADDDDAVSPPEPTRGDVRLSHVRFGYGGGAPPVFEDLSLEAKAGETIAIVGATGAGKTTLVNLLARFYDIEAGAITIDGTDVRRMKRDDLRRRLGVVPQETWLFSATVMENVRYGRPDASDEDVIEAARTACADGFIRQLPLGYETVLSERATNLSQGQRQLLAIARTLLADPPILVLDEATSSVDTRTEARIQTALLRLMKRRTSFVVAHRLSTVKGADRVLVIDRGAVVEQGTHAELLRRRGRYHALWAAQLATPAVVEASPGVIGG